MATQTPLLLGIDCGNTVVKAALFELDGREVSVHAESVDTLKPAPGFTETDMDEHWQRCVSAIAGALAKAGVSGAAIQAIGVSGHGNGLYLLDRDGQPLQAIQSMDTRAEALVASGELDEAAILPLNHQGIWAAQTPVLLRWLRQHQPDLYARIGTAFLCKDAVVHRLTGARSSDYSDMSGCGLIDFGGGGYSDALLAAYGLDDAHDWLPPLHQSTEVVGEVTAATAEITGLAAGTPVVAGLFDVVASALGSGVERTGQASLIAGTWSINQVIVEQPPKPGSVFMASTFDAERFLAIESSATSTANLEWFIREFCADECQRARDRDASVYQIIAEELIEVTLPADLPLFHPYLYGAGQALHARGGFYGVTGWHDRSALLYALFEGVVFGHRQHLDRLRAAGVSFDSVRLTGGGARSDYWAQLFADVLDVEIDTAEGSETGALGAAIAAGVGAGCFADYAEGTAQMTRLSAHYQPCTDKRDFFERRYQLFCRLRSAMEPLWQQLAEFNQSLNLND